jgi:2-dehydro-3-deoxy-D-arabinonate dehydratase
VTAAVLRLRLPDGSIRLAAGDTDAGPRALLDPTMTVAALIGGGARAVLAAAGLPGDAVPAGVEVLAPIDEQEVWAAGVTYRRSRDARMDESTVADVYDRVYAADRPELFFKAPGWRVQGPGAPIGIRADSTWDVPEPELGVMVGPTLEVVGYTIGNDVSSRSIEGENPLYLPQAKIYEGSCALGPALVPAGAVEPPLEIALEIVRDGAIVFAGSTSTAQLHRTIHDLVAWLGRALPFPAGAVLLTGTGVVPGDGFTLRAGDRTRIRVTGLGVLENAVRVVGGMGSG